MAYMSKRKETVSVSINKLVEGSHLFKVTGYSLLLERNCNDPVLSTPFEVGSHIWAIKFYPQYYMDYASVYVVQLSEGNDVRAKIKFDLLDKLRKPFVMIPQNVHDMFSMFGGKDTECGYELFISNKDLPSYLQDDSLTIRCTLRVLTSSVKPLVPPPFRETTWKLRSDLGKLLESGEGADVIFDVKGKLLSAHKCILAARSPYFRAQFFGLMRKPKTVEPTKVQDVEPAVFEALLRYIYTDSFLELGVPGVADGVQLSRTVLAQKLLSVADHYLIDELKLICEDMLREEISDENVVPFLDLAERHNCSLLRSSCLDYLADTKTMSLVMLTEEFMQLMIDCPSLLKEIKENINHPILHKSLSDLQNSLGPYSDS